MRFRYVMMLAALAVGTAGSAEAAGYSAYGQRSSFLAEPFGVYGFDCDGCVDVKYAPAPIGYRRAAVRRTRYGRVLRVRG